MKAEDYLVVGTEFTRWFNRCTIIKVNKANINYRGIDGNGIVFYNTMPKQMVMELIADKLIKRRIKLSKV